MFNLEALKMKHPFNDCNDLILLISKNKSKLKAFAGSSADRVVHLKPFQSSCYNGQIQSQTDNDLNWKMTHSCKPSNVSTEKSSWLFDKQTAFDWSLSSTFWGGLEAFRQDANRFEQQVSFYFKLILSWYPFADFHYNRLIVGSNLWKMFSDANNGDQYNRTDDAKLKSNNPN